MNSEMGEARSEELAKDNNLEDAVQEENEIKRNDNNERLGVIQPPKITISNSAIPQGNSSNDDVMSPIDFESVSLGPSLLDRCAYTSPQPMVIESTQFQASTQSEMHSRPIYPDSSVKE